MFFNGRFVMNLAQFASQQGADMKKLIALSGKSAEELCQEDCKLSPETYNKVIETAIEETDDNSFGLHTGENLNLQAAGLIVQIVHTSETIQQALEYCCEYANLGCSALPTNLIQEGEYFKYTLTPNKLWLKQSLLAVRHTIEGYLAFTVREFHSLTRLKHYPKEIRLTYENSGNRKELERVVGCPIKFEQDENAIIFPKRLMTEKVVTSDYALLQVLVSHAEKKLEELNTGKKFYEVVKKSVINLIKPEFPTIEQVASHLNMSVRTFQRKLKEEGFSFKELIDDLRQDFAKSYLRNPNLSISEVAFLLSYADSGSFIRSFKRWTGITPKNYRQSI